MVFNLGSANDFKGAARSKGSAKVLKISSKIGQFIEVPGFNNINAFQKMIFFRTIREYEIGTGSSRVQATSFDLFW